MSEIKLNGKTDQNFSSEPWETKITEIKQDEIRIHGYRIDELMGQRSFGEMVF